MTIITFSTLVAKIQAGTLSADEVTQYFELDPIKTTGLHPRFRIKLAAVDLTGVEGTAYEAGHSLAVEAGFSVGRGRRSRALTPNGTILAEGNSWTNFPPIIYPPTMIDELTQTYPINNIGHWGDELNRMYNNGSGEYLNYLKSGKIKVLLFSAGGNDMLGDDLRQCLNLFDVGHTNPGDAEYYLSTYFYKRFQRIKVQYENIIAHVQQYSPSTKLVVHGYDYVIPRPNGIFLGVHMESRGLYPFSHPELCRAIMRLIINKFNALLRAFANHHPSTFIYANLLNTVGEDDWYDFEIHPNDAAAKRLADKLDVYLAPLAGSAASIPSASTKNTTSGKRRSRRSAKSKGKALA